MVYSEEKPISFFDHIQEIKEVLTRKEALIFLDYDGTLTPIVATPDLAVLSNDMRQIVEDLARFYKVSVVSGRATDDVKAKVQIDGLFYAGSHGFEIVDPKGSVEVNKEAQEIRSVIDEVHPKLAEMLKGVPGALVEHVKYTISTHYRLVSDEDFPKIEQAVESILREYPILRKTHGKKVFEIRPRVDWHKGKAVEWILSVLRFHPEKNVAIYIGDDTTDEDAFKTIKDKGFGVLVAKENRVSSAAYRIQDTPEVGKVLKWLIGLKK